MVEGIRIENTRQVTESEGSPEVVSELYVPRFVQDFPAIKPEKAQELVQTKPVTSVVYEGKFAYLNEIEGLSFCRAYGVSCEEALRNFEAIVRIEDPMVLFERCNADRGSEIMQLISQEQQRRAQRDQDLLLTELAILDAQGIDHPEFANIFQYLDWVKHVFQFDSDVRSLHIAMLEYYSSLSRRAAGSFDPSGDWNAYFAGDLEDRTFWGTKYGSSLGYFAASQAEYYPFDRSSPTKLGSKQLLTHSSSLDVVHKIMLQNQIGGINTTRVCLSAGRLIEVRGHNFAFIFPREVVESLYATFPENETSAETHNLEASCEHENEIRTFEPIHPGLAIGFVPITGSIFPDIQGSDGHIVARGEQTLDRWQTHLAATGRLFDDSEREQLAEQTRQYWQHIQAKNTTLQDPIFQKF